jgi:hypothetical protein
MGGPTLEDKARHAHSITWIRREKRYPSGFQGSESVDLGQDLMSRLLDEL